jgi:hypothetical protein
MCYTNSQVVTQQPSCYNNSQAVITTAKLSHNNSQAQTILCYCLLLHTATYWHRPHSLHVYILLLCLLLGRRSIHQYIHSFYEPFLHLYTSRLTPESQQYVSAVKSPPRMRDTLCAWTLPLRFILNHSYSLVSVSKHSPYRSSTRSAPDELFVRHLNTRRVSQSAKSMLRSLLTLTLSAVYSRYNAQVVSKVGSSKAMRRGKQSAISSVYRDR